LNELWSASVELEVMWTNQSWTKYTSECDVGSKNSETSLRRLPGFSTFGPGFSAEDLHCELVSHLAISGHFKFTEDYYCVL